MIGKTNSVTVSGGENTLKKLIDARQSADSLFISYGGSTVDGLIQPSDTENATSTQNMFGLCNNLKSAPTLNTSKVTNMRNMFNQCTSLINIPLYDTSNVTDMSRMFYGSGIITIPLLDTSNVTDISEMFSRCTSLTSVPALNTSKVINMGYMFSNCTSLESIPLLDTSNVTRMQATFDHCSSLITVPQLNVNKVINFNYIFTGCSNLKSILMTNIGADLDIHYSTKFERTDLVTILNNLKTVTSSKKLTMGTDNLAKLTDEDKAIATNKGWTLA